MGKTIADQYSLLHFAVGVVSYFWNVSFLLGTVIHIFFEYFENTKSGMNIINKYFVGNSVLQWPGKKEYPDSIINSIGDTIFYSLGWIISYYLDKSYSI